MFFVLISTSCSLYTCTKQEEEGGELALFLIFENHLNPLLMGLALLNKGLEDFRKPGRLCSIKWFLADPYLI